MMSRLVISLLPRSKHLLISCLQSPSAVILELKKRKSVTVFIVSPSICHEVMGPDATMLVFWMLSFKPTFSLSSFTFIKRLFSSSSPSAIRVVPSAYMRLHWHSGHQYASYPTYVNLDDNSEILIATFFRDEELRHGEIHKGSSSKARTHSMHLTDILWKLSFSVKFS